MKRHWRLLGRVTIAILSTVLVVGIASDLLSKRFLSATVSLVGLSVLGLAWRWLGIADTASARPPEAESWRPSWSYLALCLLAVVGGTIVSVGLASRAMEHFQGDRIGPALWVTAGVVAGVLSTCIATLSLVLGIFQAAGRPNRATRLWFPVTRPKGPDDSAAGPIP